MSIRLSNGTEIPIEMHKVRIVQKVRLARARERLTAIEEAGYNTFLLRSRDVFLDMLTDSGTNAMSDNQQAAMLQADDAYAGGESFYKLADAVKEIFGYEYPLPAHQGRAAEHLLAKNYHFTTRVLAGVDLNHRNLGVAQPLLPRGLFAGDKVALRSHIVDHPLLLHLRVDPHNQPQVECGGGCGRYRVGRLGSGLARGAAGDFERRLVVEHQ